MAEIGAEMVVKPASNIIPEAPKPEVVDKTYFSFSLKPQEAIEGPLQQNYDLLRKGFLRADTEGRYSTTGGICTQAFKDLLAKCGDPATWTKEDMMRQDIQDATDAYRALGTLASNAPLVPEEKAILGKLITQQTKLNSQNPQVENAELLQMKKALEMGVKEDTYHRDQYGIALEWVDMGPELTYRVWELYKGFLDTTQKQREQDLKLSLKLVSDNYSVRKNPTDEANIVFTLEELRRLKQKEEAEEKQATEEKTKELPRAA